MYKNIKNFRISKFFICALLVLTLLFTPFIDLTDTYADTTYSSAVSGYFNASNVNLRTGPGTNYTSLGTKSYGTSVSVTGEATGSDGYVWYALTCEGQSGYVRSDYITLNNVNRTGYLNAEPVNFRTGPGTSYSSMGTLSYGTSVTITGEETGSDGYVWYAVTCNGKSGYVRSDFITINSSSAGASGGSDSSGTSGNTYSGDFEADIASFPESYKPLLRQLHELYPNYKFVMNSVNIDFDTAVNAETGRKKVESGISNSWKACLASNYNWSTGEWTYTEGRWTYASREVVAYYMDPRNFLTSSGVYMFLNQGYSESETLEGLRSILSGTFMSGTYSYKSSDSVDKLYGGDYAKVIMAAAKSSGVSAYAIAALIILEQGATGSVLSSGTYSGYTGYYNFFNINATGSTNTDVIVNGLTYAKNQGWDSVADSIIGGAEWYGSSYISSWGQTTYYYKDYNVYNTNTSSTYSTSDYWHQYSTSVYGAYETGVVLGNKLRSLGSNATFTFYIPVYNNMPSSAASKPAENSNINNYYFSDISGSLSPAFTRYTTSYSLSVSGDSTIRYTLPDGASYTGASSYSLNAGSNTVYLTVMSQTGYTRTTTLNVTASGACTLYVKEALKVSYESASEYVTRLYNVVLGRNPDSSGLAHWTDLICTGSKSAAEIAVNFFESDEYTGEKKSNSDIVEDCYKAMLNRASDSTGKANWKKYLDVGMTVRFICSGFARSAEFKNLCSNYGMDAGSISQKYYRDLSYGRTKFVYDLYVNCLARTPDTSGLENWCKKMAQGTSAGTVATYIIQSKEYTAKNTSSGSYINMLYKTILGRNADSAGYNNWLNKLNSGVSRDKILAGFLGSSEFSKRAESYGL